MTTEEKKASTQRSPRRSPSTASSGPRAGSPAADTTPADRLPVHRQPAERGPGRRRLARAPDRDREGDHRSNGRPAFEAICDITLELGEWVDGEFMVFAECLADGGHLASSEADARKGAYTNAFKKAAAFFGVGRQAYEGSLDDDNVPGEHVVEVASSCPCSGPGAPAPAQSIQPQPGARALVRRPPSRNRLTSKQLGAIQAIARKLGMDHGGLRAIRSSASTPSRSS